MTNILVQWHTAHMLKNPVMQSDGRPKGSPVTGICNTFRMLRNKCNLHVTSVKLRQVTSEIWACYKLVARLFLYCKLSLSETPQITAFQKLLALTELKWLYPSSRGSSGGCHTGASTRTDGGNLVLCFVFSQVAPVRTHPAPARAIFTRAPASTSDIALNFLLCFRSTLGLASWQQKLCYLDVRRSGIIAWLILWRWKRCLLFLVPPCFDLQSAENWALTQQNASRLQVCFGARLRLWDRETES